MVDQGLLPMAVPLALIVPTVVRGITKRATLLCVIMTVDGHVMALAMMAVLIQATVYVHSDQTVPIVVREYLIPTKYLPAPILVRTIGMDIAMMVNQAQQPAFVTSERIVPTVVLE